MHRLLVLMTATILALVGLSAPAGAVTGSGTLSTTTYTAGGTYAHSWTISDYTCNENPGTYFGTINFTFSGSSGSGSGLITPASGGGGTFSFSGSNNGYTYSYGGTYDSAGVWTGAFAQDGSGNFYSFGTEPAPFYFGSVTGSFTGIPSCQAPEPVVEEGNHGQCVVAAVRAGKKGTALTYYSKNAGWVGQTCSGNL